MAGRESRSRGRWRAILLGVCVTFGAALITDQGLLQRADLWLYDVLVQPVALDQPATGVVLVDDAALGLMGEGELGFGAAAKALERISAAGPRVVVLAVALAPLAPSPEEVDRLAAAIRAAPPVILRLEPWQGGERQWRPTPVIERLARAVGHGVFAVADDGVVRAAIISMPIDGREHLHVGVLAAREIDDARVVPHFDLGDVAPRDIAARSLYFRPADPTQRALRLSALLQGDGDASGLRGKAVFIGSGLSSARTVQTPVGIAQQRNVVLAYADVTENLLGGTTIRTVSPALGTTLAALVALLAVLVLPRLRTPLPAVCGALGALGLLAVHAWALNVAHWWLPLATPMLTLLLVGLGWGAARGLRTERALARQLMALGAHSDLELALRSRQRDTDRVVQRSGLDAAIDAGERIHGLLDVLESLLAELPVGIALVDADGQVAMANRAYRIGAERLEGALRGSRDRLPAAYAGLRDEPTAIELADGTVQAASLREVRLRDGSTLRVIVVADVTSLRAVELQRRNLLGFLSHDLRTPLASIAAAMDDQNPMARDPERLRHLVRSQAMRAIRLADQFSALVKAEAIDVLHPGTSDLARAADEAMDEMFGSARDAGLRLARDLPEEAPVRGDHRLIVRAVVNLVDNACKASEPGGTVALSLRATPDFWVLSVRNAAGPVPPRGEHPQGLGLGLLLVRTVAGRLGGSFELLHGSGFETVALLRLPAIDAPGRPPQVGAP